ncbi:hypothetical protein TWF970_004840 [Orbilia oligospora]|uniref:Uncharacterized protein n=1 Tax=Orbilia oligospora TaxID=2813651 RepID=A0A7C8RCU4_ORBOL|nr:hypothetical protein TWF970_004840 [Orbilia oligospora]
MPSGHHELSSLFNKEKSHLSIAIDCLRAITNPNFQEQHLPWDPPQDLIQTFGDPRRQKSAPSPPKKSRRVDGPSRIRKLRYETVYLWNHLEALATYYSRKKVQSDPDWMALRELFIELTHTKNIWQSWYSWCLFSQSRGKDLKVDASGDHGFYRHYQIPVSPLCALLRLPGCEYLIELYCYAAGWPTKNLVQEPHMVFTDLRSRDYNQLYRLLSNRMPRFDNWDAPDSLSLCVVISCSESLGFGNGTLSDSQISDALRFFTSNSSVQLTTSAIMTVLLTLPFLDKYEKLVDDAVFGRDAIKAFEIFFVEAAQSFIETESDYTYRFNRWRVLRLLIARGAPFDPNADGDAIFSCLVKKIKLTPNFSTFMEHDFNIFEDLLDLGYGSSKSASKHLFAVARIGYLNLFQKLIRGNPGILNQVDKSGCSVMHVLFQRVDNRMKIFGNLESLFNEIYTIQPESVNAQDNKSRAPLSYAVEAGNLEGVELLLRYGADIQDDDKLGQTALHTLCSQDNVLDYPDGHFDNELWHTHFRPWYCDISDSKVENDLLILQKLESASIDLNSRTKSLATPLAMALQHQRPSFLLQFLNVLQQRNEPKEYHFSVILSCDIDHRNILHYAVGRGSLRCDKEQKDLIEVIETIFASLSEEQQQLLLNGQNLSDGFTPLHAAASQGYIHLIRFFLRYRPDVKLESTEGFPAIHYLVDGRAFEKAMTSECSHRRIPATETPTVHSEARDVIEGEDVLVSLLGDIQGTEKYARMFANLQCLVLQGNWEDLHEILNTRGVNPLYEDDNGWNKFHMETVYNEVWNESTKPALDMGPLPTPSRLEYHWEVGTGNVKLDSDKLRIKCFDRYAPNDASIFLADNFISPVPSRFYFEATLTSKPLYSYTEEWTVDFEIGLMASPFDTKQWPYRDSRLTVYWNSAGRFVYNYAEFPTARVWDWEFPNYRFSGVLGVGFDYPTGKIYFTRDGRLVGAICKVSKRARWRPGIRWPYTGPADMSLNFGSRSFKFLDWEAPIEEIEAICEQRKEERLKPKREDEV